MAPPNYIFWLCHCLYTALLSLKNMLETYEHDFPFRENSFFGGNEINYSHDCEYISMLLHWVPETNRVTWHDSRWHFQIPMQLEQSITRCIHLYKTSKMSRLWERTMPKIKKIVFTIGQSFADTEHFRDSLKKFTIIKLSTMARSSLLYCSNNQTLLTSWLHFASYSLSNKYHKRSS